MIFVFEHIDNIYLYIIDILLTKIYSEISITSEKISNFKLIHLDENRNNIAFFLLKITKLNAIMLNMKKNLFRGIPRNIFIFFSRN